MDHIERALTCDAIAAWGVVHPSVTIPYHQHGMWGPMFCHATPLTWTTFAKDILDHDMYFGDEVFLFFSICWWDVDGQGKPTKSSYGARCGRG